MATDDIINPAMVGRESCIDSFNMRKVSKGNVFTHTETFEGRWTGEVFSEGEATKDVLPGELGVAMTVSCLLVSV